jgi:hypothetical protein
MHPRFPQVPLAGVRFHLRHVLQRRLLNLHAEATRFGMDRKREHKKAAARLTGGACAQLQDMIVFHAVNHVRGAVFAYRQ